MLLTTSLFCTFFGFVIGNPLHNVNEHDWRIVGGSDAANGAYPYIASLRNAQNVHFCGGSIITPKSILTAAHCIFGRFSSNVSAVVGTNRLNSGGTKYEASSLRLHFDYEPRDLRNDIGFVILRNEIAYGDLVQPVELETNHMGVGVTVNLAGWGYIEYPGNVHNQLQDIALATIATNDCRNRMVGINVVYDYQLCTLTKSGEGTCFGDSGGPLVIGRRLVGIVSWGSPNSCGVGLPDVYTRISSFVNWINTNKV